MYARIALGLALLLRFAAVRGQIVRCSVGGVNGAKCDQLIRDSVLQKYYIFSFTSPKDINDGHDKNDDKALDVPFISGKSYLLISRTNSSENGSPKSKSILHQGIDSLKAMVGISTETPSKPENFITRDQILKPITLSENINLPKLFANAVLKGTDVYRLKFHSTMIKLYANGGLISEQDYEVFLCSCYSAASIYFFTKNNEYAWNVLEDGFNLIASLLKDSENILSESFKRELLVWSAVYQTMKVDLMKYLLYNEQDIYTAENELTEKMNEISKDPLKKYPSQYLLLYRRYFLDEDFDKGNKEKLIEVIRKDFIIYKTNDMYRDILINNYLIEAEKNVNDQLQVFFNLVNAIIKPTLSVEDRLLNYKANQLVYDIVKNCIDDIGWISENENHLCTKIKESRITFKELDDMLIKYTHMKIYDYKIIIVMLKETLNDELIDEDLLHSIVTSAIDMDVYDTDVYNKKIGNVKEAIKLLKKFTTIVNKKIQIEQINEFELQQLVKAYKWLAELNAVLCSNKDTDIYQEEVNAALNEASKLINKSTINNTTNIPQKVVLMGKADNHLEFLIAKHSCKLLLPYESWENPIRNDGWIVGTESFLKSLYHIAIDKPSDCQVKMDFEVVVKSRYIHQADVLIVIFRYWYSMRNVYKAQKAIRDAMSIVVVTSEDRYRNKEAHELYSMFLLLENCGGIKNNDSRFVPLLDE